MENSLVLLENFEKENEEFLEERRTLQRKRRIRERRQREARKKRIICLFYAILACILFTILSVTVFAQPKTEIAFVESEDIYFEPMVEYEEINVLENTEDIAAEDSLSVVETEAEVLGTANHYVYDITEEEVLMFKRIVSAETYDFWSYQDCLSIATVVVNRYNSVGKGFPNDWMALFTQENQFEVYSNGRYLEVPIHENAEAAVEAALMGEVNLNSEVLYFCTDDYYATCPSDDFFRGLEHVYTVRNVYFFTE